MDEGGIEATQALPFDDYDEDETDDEAPDRPTAYLNVPLQKGFHGKQFPLFEGDNIIGRSEECNICIPLKGLSREHACIEVHGMSHFIYDKGSRNRTKRNKHFLAASVRYELKDNDQLIFGDVECEYKLNTVEASDDQDETGSEDQFQTAPIDHTIEEPVQASDKPPVDTEEDGFESDASSDILEPSQRFANGTQSMLKSISMLGDKTIGQNITVKETPMQSRTKRFIEDIVLPESGSETEDDEESISRPPATLMVADSQDDSGDERSALLAAPTQAYVCDSDATTDDDEEDSTMANKRSLLMAPTQAFVQEDSDISTCSEASPVKRSILTAATQAYVLDSETDASPAKRSLLFEPTQAYNMEEGIEPTVGYDMKEGSDKTEGSGSNLMFEPTQAYPGMAADEDEEDVQSDSSEEFVLEGDTDTEDNMDPNIMGAATLAVDTQGMDDTLEDNDATVAVEDKTQAVAAAKQKDANCDETVDVAETQMIDSATSPAKSSRRQGPANADDATQVIVEGGGTGTRKRKVDNHIFEVETQVIGDEATQVLDGGKGIGKMKTKGYPDVSVDNIAETQVFDESTLAVDDVDSKAKAENDDDGLDIDATQVIEENNASEKVDKQNTQRDGSGDLATQVFEDPKHRTKTVGKKKLSKDEIGDGETQAFSDADMETFDINAVSTLAMEGDISVPFADNDVAEKDGVDATQVFDSCEATFPIHSEVGKGACKKQQKTLNDATQVFDDATVAVTVDTNKISQKKPSKKRATKNSCDDATQVFEDVTVAVTEDSNATSQKKPSKKRATQNICDDATQVFEDATVCVTDGALKTSKKTPATKQAAKKKVCDDATQVFNDATIAVADETIQPCLTKTKFINSVEDSTQVFNEATVAVADDTDEPTENKAVKKYVDIPVLDEATMAIDEVHEVKQSNSKRGVNKKVNKKDMENTEKRVDKNTELDAETQVFDEVTLSLQDSEKGENETEKDMEGLDCYDATQILEEKANVCDPGVNTGVKRKRGGKLNQTANTNTRTEHISVKLDNTSVKKGEEKTSAKRGRKANEKIKKESAKDAQNEDKNAVLEPDDAADTSANKPTRRGRATKISEHLVETKDRKDETVEESKATVKECNKEAGEESIKLGRGQRARSKIVTESEVQINEKQIGQGKGRKTVEKKLIHEPVEVEVKSRHRRGTPEETDGRTEQTEAEYSENICEAAETQVYASETETEATQKYEMDDDDATPDLDMEDSTPTVPVIVVSPSKTVLKSALVSPKRKLSPSPKRVAFKSQSSAGSNSSQETRSHRSRVTISDEKASTSNDLGLEHPVVASTRRGGRRSLAVNQAETVQNVTDSEADHTAETVVETATRSKRGKGSRKIKGANADGETESNSTEVDVSVKEVDNDDQKIAISELSKGVGSKRANRSKARQISDQKGVYTGAEASENRTKDESVDKFHVEENTTGVRQSRLVKSKGLHASKVKDTVTESLSAEGSKDSREPDLVCDESKVPKDKMEKMSQKVDNIDTDVKQEQSCIMDKPVNSRRRTRNKVDESLDTTTVYNPNVEKTSEETKVTTVTDGKALHNDAISSNMGRTKSARNNKETLQDTSSSDVDNNKTTLRKTRRKGNEEDESTECDTDSVGNRAIKNKLDNTNEQQEDDSEQGSAECVKDKHSKGGKGKGRQSGKTSHKNETALDENSTNTTETNVRRGQRGNKLEQKEEEPGTEEDTIKVNTTVSEASVSKRGKRGQMQDKVEAAADESIVNTSSSGSEINKRGRRGKKVDSEDVETESKPDLSSTNTTLTGARGRRGKKVDGNERGDVESKVKVEVSNKVSDPEALPPSGRLKRKESDSDSQTSLEEKPEKRRKTTLDSAETPKNKNKRMSAVCTPSGRETGPDSTITSSPALRKSTTDGQKAKVMFTGVVDEQGEKTVKELGGELVNSAAECTHLVTDQVRRTVKFLCCLSLGRPIVTPQWLVSSKNTAFFTDWSPFLIHDDASEKKYKFTLHLSLDKARSKPLLDGYSVHVTKSVKPPPDQMNEILKCAGAKVLSSMPKTPQPLTVVVSCPEDNSVCDAAVKAGIKVVSPEFVLTGVLRQEVDLDAHALFAADQGSKRMSLNTSTLSEPGGKKRRK